MSEITKHPMVVEVATLTVQVGKQFFPLSSQTMALVGRLAWAFQEHGFALYQIALRLPDDTARALCA